MAHRAPALQRALDGLASEIDGLPATGGALRGVDELEWYAPAGQERPISQQVLAVAGGGRRRAAPPTGSG